MFKFLARVLGLVLVSAGIVGAVVDAARSLAQDALVLTPLGQIWFSVHPSSLGLAQVGLERHVWPPLWDPVMLGVLQQPGWAVALVLGFLLMLAGTRRRRRGRLDGEAA